MTGFSYQEYLAAKKSLDDRSLNRHVYETMERHLRQPTMENPLRILEIGSGIGTMIERLVDRKLFTSAHYTAIDLDPRSTEAAKHRLENFAKDARLDFAQPDSDQLTLRKYNATTTIQFVTGDAVPLIRGNRLREDYDLVIAHAILDILDIHSVVPELLQLLAPDGLYYFTLNYDGVTRFLPIIDRDLDKKIYHAYHVSMDKESHRTGSQTGWRLLEYLSPETNLLAAGSSDWIVHPLSGEYPEDEQCFLQCILDTINTALTDKKYFNQDQFARWIDKRYEQLENHELIYFAHQLDFCGSTPE